jgi:hypothetical protein
MPLKSLMSFASNFDNYRFEFLIVQVLAIHGLVVLNGCYQSRQLC